MIPNGGGGGGGGRVAGSGAQTNFGDLTPYLTNVAAYTFDCWLTWHGFRKNTGLFVMDIYDHFFQSAT
jgi:hypothetical protein